MEPDFDLDAKQQLLLARLLVPTKRPPTTTTLRNQLAPYFNHRLTNAEWNAQFDAAIASLVDSELVSAKPLALTDTGRTRAMNLLGMSQVPPRLTWRTLKDAWLVPRSLEANIASPRDRERLKSADGLRSYLLKREHELPLEGCPTLTQSLDALVWKQLGIETDRRLTRNAIVEEIVGRLLDAAGRLKPKQLPEMLAAKAIGATQVASEELRLAAIRRWIEKTPTATAGTQPAGVAGTPDLTPSSNGDDLHHFAEAVHAAARASTTGRFGSNKVFIRHVWDRMRSQPRFPSLEFEAFKDLLVEANRAGSVALSRADLVEAMDPADVAASEIRHRNAVFHFVQLPSDSAGTPSEVGERNSGPAV